MNSFTLSPQLKNKFKKAVASQPERFHDGDNYAGRVYIMSEKNKRQQARVLKALGEPELRLSRSDLIYLYCVVAYAYSRSRSYQTRGYYNYLETYYRLDKTTPYWRKVAAFFQDAGIKKVPAFTAAWE